jgi:hypothetical protein
VLSICVWVFVKLVVPGCGQGVFGVHSFLLLPLLDRNPTSRIFPITPLWQAQKQQRTWPVSYGFLALSGRISPVPCPKFSKTKQPSYFCCSKHCALLFILVSRRMYVSLSNDKCLACHSKTLNLEIIFRPSFVYYSTKTMTIVQRNNRHINQISTSYKKKTNSYIIS